MLLHMFFITYCIYRRTWWFQLMIGCHQHYVITLLFGTLCCAVTIIDWLSMQPSPIIVLQLQVLLWLSSCPLKKMQASIISFSRTEMSEYTFFFVSNFFPKIMMEFFLFFHQKPWWFFLKNFLFSKNKNHGLMKNFLFSKNKNHGL